MTGKKKEGKGERRERGKQYLQSTVSVQTEYGTFDTVMYKQQQKVDWWLVHTTVKYFLLLFIVLFVRMCDVCDDEKHGRRIVFNNI